MLERPQLRDILASRARAVEEGRMNNVQNGRIVRQESTQIVTEPDGSYSRQNSAPPAYDTLSNYSGPPPSYHSEMQDEPGT